MNICLLSKNLHCRKGGTEIYPYRMAIALSKLGHSVHIICTNDGTFSRDLEEYKNIFVHDINFKEDIFRGSWRINRLVPLNEIRYSFLIAKKINQLMKDCKIDIVESGDVFAEGFWFSFIKKMPLVVRLHGHHSLPIDAYKTQISEGALRQKLMYWMEMRLILNANSLSCVSSNFAELARSLYAIKNKYLVTIYSGIDDVIFKSSDFNGRDDNTVTFVGWLRESKGLGVLAEAIPLVLEKKPETNFVFIGKDTKIKGSEKTWVQLLNEKIPSMNLKFIFPVESKELAEKYYGKTAISVFPSLYEPGGTVAQEAMMCGCPVIATKVGGFIDLIKDKEDGILVSPGNARELSTAILDLLFNKDLRKRLGECASKKAKILFAMQPATDATIELYHKTIESFDKNNLVSHAES